jgi:hypothetical protein
MRQMARVTMSMRELDRLKCVQAVVDGDLNSCRRGSCRVGLQLLQTELQLRDLGIELLRGAAELHPLEACELELELLDQHIA